MATQSLLILVGYSVTAHPCCNAVGTHPIGMLSCFVAINEFSLKERLIWINMSLSTVHKNYKLDVYTIVLK